MHHKSPFVAIDFETADYGPDSACAVALVRVEGSRIVQRSYFLIRPPAGTLCLLLSARHYLGDGGRGADLRGIVAGTCSRCWRTCSFCRPTTPPSIAGCCTPAAPPTASSRPGLPFLCTVKLARQTWKLFPTKLPNVCDYLGIPLDHHNAASDAEACARIVIAARKSKQ